MMASLLVSGKLERRREKNGFGNLFVYLLVYFRALGNARYAILRCTFETFDASPKAEKDIVALVILVTLTYRLSLSVNSV
jgi:hypothetical protein